MRTHNLHIAANSFEQQTIRPLLAIKLVLMAMFWGGTFIAGKQLTQELPLSSAAFLRFAVAGVLLIGIAYRFEGGLPRLNRREIVTTAALGLSGVFLYNLFFFAALSHIPAGRTALFVSLTPITTALLASLIYRERLGITRWLGIAIALFGALIVITRGDLINLVHDVSRSFGNGEMLMLLAVLSWSGYTLISRIAMQSLSPIATTTYATLWGLLILGFGAVPEFKSIQWTDLEPTVWISIVYLGAMGTVLAFVWYYEGIRELGPSRTAVFTNLVPAFGVLLSAGFLGEDILVSMIAGGVISVLGVSLTNYSRTKVNPPLNA